MYLQKREYIVLNWKLNATTWAKIRLFWKLKARRKFELLLIWLDYYYFAIIMTLLYNINDRIIENNTW